MKQSTLTQWEGKPKRRATHPRRKARQERAKWRDNNPDHEPAQVWDTHHKEWVHIYA